MKWKRGRVLYHTWEFIRSVHHRCLTMISASRQLHSTIVSYFGVFGRDELLPIKITWRQRCLKQPPSILSPQPIGDAELFGHATSPSPTHSSADRALIGTHLRGKRRIKVEGLLDEPSAEALGPAFTHFCSALEQKKKVGCVLSTDEMCSLWTGIRAQDEYQAIQWANAHQVSRVLQEALMQENAGREALRSEVITDFQKLVDMLPDIIRQEIAGTTACAEAPPARPALNESTA